jgi:hypothetical protein
MGGITGFLAAALLVTSSFPAFAQGPAAADRPGAIFAEGRTAAATVEAVDGGTREVTLKDADGVRMTFKAGPEVCNFDRIRAGDRVTANNFQELAIFCRPRRGGCLRLPRTETLGRAAHGQKPRGASRGPSGSRRPSKGVDPQSRRIISLRGPRGRLVTLKVGDHVRSWTGCGSGTRWSRSTAESRDIKSRAVARRPGLFS